MNPHRRFRDYPQRSLAPDAQMVHVDPIRRIRHRPRRQHAFGRHHAQSNHHILDLAVLVALHPGGPCRDPAPQRRVHKRIRKMSQRHAMRTQLLFQVGAKNSRLHPRRKRLRVHFQHPPHPPHIQRHHHPLVFHPLQAAGNIRPTAERNHHDVVMRRRSQRHQHVILALRIDHQIRSAFRRSAPHAK